MKKEDLEEIRRIIREELDRKENPRYHGSCGKGTGGCPREFVNITHSYSCGVCHQITLGE